VVCSLFLVALIFAVGFGYFLFVLSIAPPIRWPWSVDRRVRAGRRVVVRRPRRRD
jgi:hypothetical protein